jgi:sec-independent protein translocase protein TatA
MGGFSLWHILILAIILLLVFGGNRFSSMMSDVAKGLKNFKKGLSEEEEDRVRDRDRSALPHNHDRPIDVTPEPRRTADPVPRNDQADS